MALVGKAAIKIGSHLLLNSGKSSNTGQDTICNPGKLHQLHPTSAAGVVMILEIVLSSICVWIDKGKRRMDISRWHATEGFLRHPTGSMVAYLVACHRDMSVLTFPLNPDIIISCHRFSVCVHYITFLVK